MRVTSAFFVALLLRRVFADGSFAAVARRGAAEAGAVHVLARGREGALALFAPASQTEAADDGGRRFMREALADEAALDARLAREARFDPDFWLVEIETDDPARYLAIVEP